MATVLILDPMSTHVEPFMPWLLKGSLNQSGNTFHTIPYNNFPGIDNIDDGVELLNDWLVANYVPGMEIILFGYSEGCQVISKWLRIYGPGSSISPADMRALLIGHAASKYGGFAYQHSVFAPVADIAGVPEDTDYDVTIFARQYDAIADFPTAAPIQAALESISGVAADASLYQQMIQNIIDILSDQTYLLATLNALSGAVFVHNYYFEVSPDDSNNLEYVEGNITYKMSPTRLANEWDRDAIESAYDRIYGSISNPPTPTPPPPVITPPAGDDPGLDYHNLTSGNLMTRMMTAEKIATRKTKLDQEWVITRHDKLWVPAGSIGDDMIELSGTDPRNNLPTATLKIKGSSEHVLPFMECTETMVGVTVETGGLRFVYYVKSFDYEYKEGEWIGTANLAGIWDVLNFLQIWPNFLLPLQAQIPSHAIFIWALCTVVETMVSECALRIQSGLWEFVNNALSLNADIRTWFGTLLESNGNIFQALKTPIYVVHTNPLLDTSPLVARTVRMESCGTVITDITRAYGVDVRMDLWLPAGLNGKNVDDDQPDAWANLTQPTYVLTAKDRSQIEGPTKTVLDSVIRTVVDLQGSLLGEALEPLLNPQGLYAPEGVFIAPTLGLNFVEPWAVLIAPEEGEKGNIVDCKLSFHTHQGWRHIVGGRSPKWLNDFMNATFAWLIDSISILIGFTGIPSNLLEGFMNNVFLAFQQVDHFGRRNSGGPYHPAMETFTATQSAPYNIETLFAFINKLWDTRGYVSAMATFRDGEVYKLGRDVFRGGLISVLYLGRTRLLTDYVENIMFRISATLRDIFVQIGDGKAEEAPLAKHQRFITGIFESINVITLAPQSGGLA